jgi:protein arginine kinase
MDLNEFLISPKDTARRTGPNDRIVISSRIRLARNVRGIAFPGWGKKPDRLKAAQLIRPAVESLPDLSGCFAESMDNLAASMRPRGRAAPWRSIATRRSAS